MTVERAMEILNPEHREVYESIDPVNEACEMGIKALSKEIAKELVYLEEKEEWACPCCKNYAIGSRGYCTYCGQKLNLRG